METRIQETLIPEYVDKKVVYVAEDGREFDREEDCEYHEARLLSDKMRGNIFQAYKKYLRFADWYCASNEEELAWLQKFLVYSLDPSHIRMYGEWIVGEWYSSKPFGDEEEYVYIYSWKEYKKLVLSDLNGMD